MVYPPSPPATEHSREWAFRPLTAHSRVLVVCGHTVTESMKNDIAVAQRLGITATTLEGILTVKGQGRR